MFKRFGIALSVLTAVISFSCSSDGGLRVEALSCEIDSVDCAFVTPDGNVTECALPALRLSPVVNGFFNASLSDGIAVYRWNDGNPESLTGLSKLKSAGFFAEGVIPVSRQGSHIQLVDADAKVVAELELPEGEITECGPCFVDGLLAVTTDKATTGFVDNRGKMIVDPIYSSVGPVSDRRFVAMYESAEGNVSRQQFVVVDFDGHTLYDFPSGITPVDMKLHSSRVVVRTPSGFGVCDISSGGSVTPLPAAVRAVTETAGGLIVYRVASGMKGLLDIDGKLCLQPVFRQIRIGADNRVAVYDGKIWALMDSNGENRVDLPGIISVAPAGHYAQESGFAFVARTAGGACSLLDAEGKKLGSKPLSAITYGDLTVAAKVVSGYPSATTPVELPFEEEMEF